MKRIAFVLVAIAMATGVVAITAPASGQAGHNGKPGADALMKTCFACHVPAKDHDYVFTRYAP